MQVLIPLVVAYLLGAIPFGLIVARAFGVKDLRQRGSGNIGATNVWRQAGAKAAIWVYILDISKGVAAVLIAGQFEQSLIDRDLLLVLAGVSAVLGNVFPIYLKFKGGKGVNTSLGVVVTLLPFQALAAVGIFLIVAFASRYISLGSIVAAIALFAILLIQRFALGIAIDIVYILMSGLLALAIVLTHRQNIARLIAGTESRFSLSSKANGGSQ